MQLETVQSSLQVDPENSELQSLKTELEELINLTETSIAELKPPSMTRSHQQQQQQQKPSSTKVSTPSTKDTKLRESPHHKPGEEQSPTDEVPLPASFSVNENVLARWVSGDNSFYPARITSITGSSSNPVYVVSFKSYATVETLTIKDIKPMSGGDSRKRKADGTMPGITGSGSSSKPPPPPPAEKPPHYSSVISAAADINPALANQARKEPSKATDGPPRPPKVPRKVKATNELEQGKMKWKDFANKANIGRKDSMFRTGEGLNSRGDSPLLHICVYHKLKFGFAVGFTGSGRQMRKDPTRTRHIYQKTDEEGY